MKRLLMLSLVCLSLQTALMAQNPEGQVSGGFSVLTYKPEGVTERTTPLGWQAGGELSVWKNISAIADFGGQYKQLEGTDTTFQFYQYAGGARVHKNLGQARAFGEAMFGAMTVRGGDASQSAFMMGYGGGVDWSLNKNWAVRLVQVDWVPTRPDGMWKKNQIRLGFGLVWKTAK